VNQPRSVADVLSRIHTTWSELVGTLDGLSQSQLVEADPEGWSIKDHLAHITAWDRVPAAIMRGDRQHVAFGLDEGAYERIDSVDQLNAIIYERHRDRALADVQADMQQAHADLVSAVEKLSDADLDRAIADFGSDPDDTRPLRDKIEGDSYGHYVEHAGWLRQLRHVLFEQGG